MGSTLLYLTPYVAVCFGFCPKSIFEPLSIFTLLGDSIVPRKVYSDCVVCIHNRETLVDLIEFNIVDFDVILSMD